MHSSHVHLRFENFLICRGNFSILYFSIYTLSDLGDSSNMIDSLSWTMTF